MEIQKESKLGLTILKMTHVLFLTYSFLGHVPAFRDVLKIGTWVAIVLLIFNFTIQYDRFKPRELVWYVGLMAMALLCSVYSGDYGFFKLMLFAGSVRKINFKNIVRFDLHLRATLIVIVSCLCIAGFVPNVIVEYEGHIQQSMGFTNPNTLGTAIFVLICDTFYVSELKLKVKTTIVLLAVLGWVFFVARSRSVMYGTLALTITVVLYQYCPRLFRKKWVKLLLYVVPIILSVSTFLLVEGYNEKVDWIIELDRILSGRLNIISRFDNALNPTLLGQPISETLDRSLDNTFAFIWMCLGIGAFCVFIIGYFRIIKRNYDVNMKLCIIMVSFLIYGMSEHLWINVDYNIFMLAYAANPAIEYAASLESNAEEAESEENESEA